MEIEEVSHIEKFFKLTQIMSKVHSVMKLKHDCFYSSCKAEEQCHFIYLFIFPYISLNTESKSAESQH